MHRRMATDDASLVVIARIHHRKAGNGAGDRLDQKRQQGELRPVPAIGVHLPTQRFQDRKRSCRERVCKYVWISVVAVYLKKKTIYHNIDYATSTNEQRKL